MSHIHDNARLSDQEPSTCYPDLLVAVHTWVYVCLHMECEWVSKDEREGWSVSTHPWVVGQDCESWLQQQEITSPDWSTFTSLVTVQVWRFYTVQSEKQDCKRIAYMCMFMIYFYVLYVCIGTSDFPHPVIQHC